MQSGVEMMQQNCPQLKDIIQKRTNGRQWWQWIRDVVAYDWTVWKETILQFYYMSTIQVARALKDYVANEAKLPQDDRALLDALKPEDIQILLGLH